MSLTESEITALKDRLAVRPLTILRFYEATQSQPVPKPEIAPRELPTAIRVAGLAIDTLIKAKINRELWPPAALADAELAANELPGTMIFSMAALAEMRELFLSRILRLDWLAVTIASTGVVSMNGLRRLSPEQIPVLESDYQVRLRPNCYLFETGYTVPEKRRFRLSMTMKKTLMDQILPNGGNSDVDILTVILDTQAANIALNRSLGFLPLASMTISQGPERGRILRLYSRRTEVGRDE